MRIWRIEAIPAVPEEKLNTAYESNALRRILFSLQNTYSNTGSISLYFIHKIGEKISLYMAIHEPTQNDMVTVLEKRLTSDGYQLRKLEAGEAEDLYSCLMDMASSEIRLVVKKEKAVTTPYMREGYYYWSDPIKCDDRSAADGFSGILETLQQCQNSCIAIQLIPTVFQPYEAQVIQYLKSVADSRSANQSCIGYEPYAIPAFSSYQYYADHMGQATFLYNVFVASQSASGRILSNQLISTLKASSREYADYQDIAVNIAPIQNVGIQSFPHHLNNIVMRGYRDPLIWSGRMIPPTELARLPFLVTADEALTLFRLPYDDGKTVGFSVTKHQKSNGLLDKAVTDPKNLIMGHVYHDEKSLIGVPLEDFAKHSLIVGMPGSGKTTFAIHLLMEFYKRRIPFIAIEPTKTEYRSMLRAIPELQIFTPGKNSVSPYIVNPFIPPKGISLETFIPSVFSAFKAAFSMTDPLDVLFMKAIRACYNRYGWRDYSTVDDPDVQLFGLHEFILVFKEIIENSGYGRDTKSNLESGGMFRISYLLDQNPNIFDAISTMDVEDLLSKPTIIELNAIDDREEKALIIAILLLNISVYTKNKKCLDRNHSGIGNVILLDEAHVFLGQRGNSDDSQSRSTNYSAQILENLVAEIRAYGTGIIIADQRPSAVGSGILSNTDIKVAFRLTERNEKEIIGNSMDMEQDVQNQLSQLEKGQAYVFYHKLREPIIISTPDIWQTENLQKYISDEEVKNCQTYWDDKIEKLKPYSLCRYCLCRDHTCNYKMRADAEFYSKFIWNQTLPMIMNGKDSPHQEFLRRIWGVPILLGERLMKYDVEYRKSLVNCIRISLQRKGNMEKNLKVTDKEMATIFNTSADKESCT